MDSSCFIWEDFLERAEAHHGYFENLANAYPDGGHSATIGGSMARRWLAGLEVGSEEALALYLEVSEFIRKSGLSDASGWGAFRIDLLSWLTMVLRNAPAHAFPSMGWRTLVGDLEATFGEQPGDAAATGVLLAQCWLALLDGSNAGAFRALAETAETAGLKMGQTGFKELLSLYVDRFDAP